LLLRILQQGRVLMPEHQMGYKTPSDASFTLLSQLTGEVKKGSKALEVLNQIK